MMYNKMYHTILATINSMLKVSLTNLAVVHNKTNFQMYIIIWNAREMCFIVVGFVKCVVLNIMKFIALNYSYMNFEHYQSLLRHHIFNVIGECGRFTHFFLPMWYHHAHIYATCVSFDTIKASIGSSKLATNFHHAYAYIYMLSL